MRKNLKTGEMEPKNSNHGKMEQARVNGPGGKGTQRKTRTHVVEGGKDGMKDPGKQRKEVKENPVPAPQNPGTNRKEVE
jgi:hypothetical protein